MVSLCARFSMAPRKQTRTRTQATTQATKKPRGAPKAASKKIIELSDADEADLPKSTDSNVAASSSIDSNVVTDAAPSTPPRKLETTAASPSLQQQKITRMFDHKSQATSGSNEADEILSAQPTPLTQMMSEIIEAEPSVTVAEDNVEEFTSFVDRAMETGVKIAAELDSGASKSEEQLRIENLAKTGKFDVRDPTGQLFIREHPPGSKQRAIYDACTNRDAKKDFRTEWAKRKYGDILQKKWQQTSYKDVRRELATSLTFGGLVRLYGGWKWAPAVAGAKSTASKCALMGPPFIEKDSWSGLHFLVFQKQHESEMTRAWGLFQEETQKYQRVLAPAAEKNADGNKLLPSSNDNDNDTGNNNEKKNEKKKTTRTHPRHGNPAPNPRRLREALVLKM